ncbi:LacI family transcriptional regulator [Glycomyces sp. TRM65418]|uniref:LacI family DNA-binding transcriptional regulator n=1 Tax=Glycomyces sp. TRM65418 TaxID=2867006 RepID=UPI001CE53F1F|nr:LacI family DNA-binding transcriptional regulator [Glycomyces sp. TRM65418]MCC3763421.1 LacI family transcriptional regulator [Glycomyces sp. TRM65418]QZD57412.1 LacI family transcriptional regulator [Glycomyces sp. TRM65418]
MSQTDAAARRRKPPATIYDIARMTGVSPSTVSRALNKPGRLSEKTEQRIRKAAEELGYRINPMARALPTGKTGTLALLVSDITNPVYFDLVRGAERVASETGSTLVFADSQESPELERATAERLQTSVDGLLLVGSRLEDGAIEELSFMKPLVIVNRLVTGIPAVIPDVLPGMTAALERLRDAGHRRVAYLAGPEASWMNRLRRQTLFDLAEAWGLSAVELKTAAPTREGGAAAYRHVMDADVTAVMAYNDLVALGLLRECRDHGVDVPGRLSIVGFDDIFGADLPTPALSTIRSPFATIGEMAIRRLLVEIDGGPAQEEPVLPTEFVSRESVAPPAEVD